MTQKFSYHQHQFLLMLVLISLSTSAFGQVRFNKTFDVYGTAELCSNICVTPDSGFLFTGNYLDVNNRVMYISKLDRYGDLVWKKNYFQDNYDYYSGLGGALQNFGDTCSVLSGSYVDALDESNAFVLMLDNYGDTLWMKTYNSDLSNIFQTSFVVNDSLIISLGAALTSDSAGQMYAACTDKNGNKIWSNYYGGDLNESGFTIDQTSDGGFIFSGWSYSYGAGGSDIYIVRTDPQGNYQWHKTFGGTKNEGGGCKVATNGDLIVYGAIVPEGWNAQQAYIARLNSSGELLWEKYYGMSKSKDDGFGSAIELNDGSIVMRSFDYSLNGKSLGRLMKVNSDGDSLWSRTYRTPRESNHFSWDMQSTPDGGFVMAGFVFSDAANGLSQDAWVIKVDSMGCDTADCHIISSVEPSISSNEELVIYPNPTTGKVSVISSKLSEQNLIIFNSIGEKLYSQIMPQTQNTNSLQIDLSEFPNGFYIIQLSDSESSSMKKLLLQK